MTQAIKPTRRDFLQRSVWAGAATTLAVACRAEAGEERLPWRVGTGSAEITPPLDVGILMSSGRRLWKPFEGVRLPLLARAAVVANSDRRVAVVALDLLGLGDESIGGIGRFKQRVAASAGEKFQADDLVLCSSHTHSGPASCGCTDLIRTKPFEKWVDRLVDQIGSAIKSAAGSLEPCRLTVGSRPAPGHCVNRRTRTTRGIRPYRTTLPPEEVIGPEGPTDESVNVAAFLGRSGRPVALLVGATCHPVHEMCIPQVSPDFPGEMSVELERRHPGSAVLFLQGAAGNVNPPTVSDGAAAARKHGHRLADVVDKTFGSLRRIEGDDLALCWQTVKMPARDPTGQPLPKPLATRIAALRLGRAAFCFLPGEPFIETSLAIRKASPWEFTVVVGYAEEWIGYIPTDLAFDNGGYETRAGRWSKLRPGSENILRQEAIKLLRAERLAGWAFKSGEQTCAIERT